MALGTQVPWTFPGGTPCCCVPTCASALPAGYAPITISEETYLSLYAGGTVVVDATTSTSSQSRSFFGGENISTAATGTSNIAFALTANQCVSTTTVTGGAATATSSTGGSAGMSVGYKHYLKGPETGSIYKAVFELSVGLSSYNTTGGFIEAAAFVELNTDNGLVPGITGQASCGTFSTCLEITNTQNIDFVLDGQNLTIPGMLHAGTYRAFNFFRIYTGLTGVASATFTYTPSAP